MEHGCSNEVTVKLIHQIVLLNFGAQVRVYVPCRLCGNERGKQTETELNNIVEGGKLQVCNRDPNRTYVN